MIWKLSYMMSALIVCVACLAQPPKASAAAISMFQTLYPAPAEVDPVGGITLASLAAPVVSNHFTGMLTSTVINNDTSNPFGGLTFTYLLVNDANSSQPIGRVTFNGFATYLVDAGYQTPATGRAPTLINRSVDDVIGFSYIATIGPGVLSPGLTSALMVVQTNATAYTFDHASVINGDIASAPIYAPIPEPATAAFLGVCALLMLRRRAVR